MTLHPCRGMTKPQIDAFERIAIGQDAPIHPKSAGALLARGLIIGQKVTIGRDAFGPIEIMRYHVPLPIHVQWCEWCSEQPENAI